MLKHAVKVAFILILALSLFACSRGGSDEPEATALPTLPPAEAAEPTATPTEEAAEESTESDAAQESSADEAHSEEEAHAEDEAHAEGTESAESETAEAGHMDDMMGSMSDEAMEMMDAAIEAAAAGDWETVKSHLTHLIEMTSDGAHKTEMEHLLEEIEAGDTEHFADEMQAMREGMMGTMPKMTGTMSTEAMEMVHAAMEAAKAGDWETVTSHMNQVLDVSTDAQQKAAVEHLLEEIEEGNTDHFIEELEELLSNVTQVSPAAENMQAALVAAQADDWDTAKQEIEAAIDLSTDPQEKASLEHLLEEVEEGNADHFIEQLEAVMRGEEAAHD